MKIPRYKLIPALLAVYALFMTLYFGLDLLRDGQHLRFYSTVIAETAVIVLTYFALRRRYRNRK